MRGSRESLSVRSSCESVRSLTDSLWLALAAGGSRGVADGLSVSTSALAADADPRADRGAPGADADPDRVRVRRRASHWKLLKRAVCKWVSSRSRPTHSHRLLTSTYNISLSKRLTYDLACHLTSDL